jgi:hypothetical protein
MGNTITEQNGVVRCLKELYQKEKQKARFYRLKYQEAAFGLRRKEEQYQSLEKTYLNVAERYEFIRSTSDQTMQELLSRQQEYQQTIHTLEHELEELRNCLLPTAFGSSHSYVRV